MKKFIGSRHHGQNCSTSGPILIDPSRSIEDNTNNFSLYDYLADAVFEAMVRAVDGNNIFGNATGDYRGEVDKDGLQNPSKGIAQYSAWDGWLKKAWQNSQAVEYPCVQIHIPEIVAGDCIFLTIDNAAVGGSGGGNTYAWETVEEAAEFLNSATTDISGKHPYTASVVDGDLKVIGNDPTVDIYCVGGLQAFVGETIAACGHQALEATILANASMEADIAHFCDYYEFKAASNYKEYFSEKMIWIVKTCAQAGNGSNLSGNDFFFAVSPLLMNLMECQELECSTCTNYAEIEAQRARFMPRFIPVQVMFEHDYWFASTTDNLYFLTNVSDARLGLTSQWYDQECQLVKLRKEMVGGVEIGNYSKFFSNIKNSPFVNNLHAPQRPLDNCPVDCPTTDTGVKANACVTKTCAEDGTAVLLVEDNTLCPTGVNLVGADIVINYVDAAADVAESIDVGASDIEIPLTAEECEKLAFITYTLTFSDETTSEVVIPVTAFEKIDCPEVIPTSAKGKVVVEDVVVEEEAPKDGGEG